MVTTVAFMVGVCCTAAPLSAAPYDVLVHGATPSGVAAAVAAGREGRSVVLIEPGTCVPEPKPEARPVNLAYSDVLQHKC